MKPVTEAELARFLKFVDAAPGYGPKGRCHKWDGANSGGAENNCYGTFSFRGHKEKAHRVAFFIATGKWPENNVCHKCDFTLCVKGSHLVDRTQGWNEQDCYNKKRRTQRGEHNGNCKLSKKKARRIRRMYASGDYYQRELAKRFGVTQVQISEITLHKSWS